MNKRKTAVICLSCLMLGGVCAYGLATDDALITESYLTEVFLPEVKEYINQAVAGKEDGANSASVSKFEVVSVKKGKTFIGKASCEFILRQGAGFVNASDLGGLNDVTGGTDLGSGQDVPPNHLLIVPRDDGRGFTATKDVLIMVRGEYTIK